MAMTFKNKKLHKWQLFLVFFLPLFFYLFTIQSVQAETISEQIYDLQQQIQELEEQAGKYKSNIAQKQKEVQSLKNQIDILNNQILNLQLRIKITITQIDKTTLQIENLSDNIFDTEDTIDKNKATITKLIRSINDFDSRTLLASVLQHARLSDFMNSIRYTENLQSQLLSNLIELKELKQNLENQKGEVEVKKEELENLNQKLGRQKVATDGTKLSKQNLLRTTRGQESRYKSLLSDVEKKKAEFFVQLQELEAEARKEGVFIVHITAGTIPPKGTKLFSMPYDDSILTQRFGYTTFARRGAYGGAAHNGIDLVSGIGSPIQSIGKGVILASGFNNGWGNWVAVRHDNDLVSLYGHMRYPTHISVEQGVDDNTVIGYEGTTGNVTGSHLHLSLYYDFFTYISKLEKRVYFNYFEGTLNPFDYI